MLTLSKKGFSNSYKVADGHGVELAVLAGCGKGQTGSVDLNGRSIVLSQGPDGTTFAMQIDGANSAVASWPKPVEKHFVIDQDGTTLVLDCAFIRNKPYDVALDGQPVGSISLSKFTGRVVTVDLPETLPLELRLFAGWLAVRTWNAQAEVKIVQ